MNIARCFLAGLVAFALAQASPLDLSPKLGAKQNQFLIPRTSACAVNFRLYEHLTIIDEIEQPLVPIHDDHGRCIVTAAPPAGFFSADQEPATGRPLPARGVPLLSGSCLFGGILLLISYIAGKFKPHRHRAAVLRRSPCRRRSMALI